ncbi:acyltransferase-domain-containing protein [Paraphaeosphaeria sporulosa]|uniref:Acyltransferase-domain-containing protein n=1 Tax=Paraphaeosphaeria sporulosa TaxID=1460663 RepID=A0A177CW50_9PLEO|nr:acyltransferase-domain-containing protein [Paraphaeosphaeria sporulosa]OAG11441.1 acyltransferase-domain-containing protein [Paraphaeosphaeria sporulosa]
MNSPAMRKKKDDFGAGLKIAKQNIAPEEHPAGPPKYGELNQAERAFTLASTFLSGVLAISASQVLGAPLKLIDPVFYEGYMAYTKECFAILVTCLTQWWAPTVVRVSGDSSMIGQLIKTKDGSLKCNFSERLVLMANHQLYTDWLYLWWIAYTNGLHGFVYIILKESLKNVPIIGWSAQMYNFIFLARNWEEDQQRFKKALSKLSNPKDPMWLIIFPEGTNLSASTRERSKKWAAKNGLEDMKHQLLPRSTGLKFCLNELKDSTEWLYDCTIAYEGVPPGQFGQDIFTLRSSFFEGRPPKSVNMHWRRFHISTIPIHNTKAFEVWLRNRWREKDYMLEYFQRHTRFPAEEFWKDHLDVGDRSSQSDKQTIRTRPRPAVQIETEVKSANWNDFVKIFAPITGVMTAMSVAYGASPGDLIPGGEKFFGQMMKSVLSGGDLKGLPSPDELEKMIEGAAKIGANQAASPENRGRVQHLTQENLAKLVKETAIKEGVVLPGGRRASTALPRAPTRTLATSTAPRANSAVGPSGARRPAATPAAKPKPAAKPQEMREVKLASGVTIKIPKPEVEKAKDTGTITTANGLKIRVGKKEIEAAEQKKGTTFMTSSGVPIKISPSGALNVGQKQQTTNATPSAPAKPKYVFKPSTNLPTNTSAPKAGGATSAMKKPAPANGAVKKSVSVPTKKPAATPTAPGKPTKKTT